MKVLPMRVGKVDFLGQREVEEVLKDTKITFISMNNNSLELITEEKDRGLLLQ